MTYLYSNLNSQCLKSFVLTAQSRYLWKFRGRVSFYTPCMNIFSSFIANENNSSLHCNAYIFYLTWSDGMIKNPSFVISVAIMELVIERVCQLAVPFALFYLKVISCTERILQTFHRTFHWKT